MSHSLIQAPEPTAVRVALWRALHVEIDPEPHVLNDVIGAQLVNEMGWRDRQDMEPQFSKPMRASIVGRARLIEDLVTEQARLGVSQYVILGAGLDTFAQRRPEVAKHLHVFEIDQPSAQEWKKKRLFELGFEIPERLHFVPVDFESNESWWERLILYGFNPQIPAVVVSTGVSMYLTKKANAETLARMATLAPSSTFAMTFMLALDHLDPKERSIMEFVMRKASESGTPFISLFSLDEIMSLSKMAGFNESRCVSGEEIFQRYFSSRTDGLRAGSAEAFLIART